MDSATGRTRRKVNLSISTMVGEENGRECGGASRSPEKDTRYCALLIQWQISPKTATRLIIAQTAPKKAAPAACQFSRSYYKSQPK